MQGEPTQRGGEEHTLLAHGRFPVAMPLRLGKALQGRKKLREILSRNKEGKGSGKDTLACSHLHPHAGPLYPAFAFPSSAWLLHALASSVGQDRNSTRQREMGFLWLSGKLHGVRGGPGLSGSSKARAAPGGRTSQGVWCEGVKETFGQG